MSYRIRYNIIVHCTETYLDVIHRTIGYGLFGPFMYCFCVSSLSPTYPYPHQILINVRSIRYRVCSVNARKYDGWDIMANKGENNK